MENLLLIMVTGLSGAGKSTALARLEDDGFYCVDNLPGMLLPEFVSQCLKASPRILKAAVGIDGRGRAFGVQSVIELPDKHGVDYRILFLDCDDETLLRRYIETRHRHPFAYKGDVAAGIAHERALLQDIREKAHIVIDTTALKPYMLYKKLDEALCARIGAQTDILLTSFGFKRGIPIDADIVLDMRFFPNPFYEGELRSLSGLDEPVKQYVMSDKQAAPFFDAAEKMLVSSLPGFFTQGKQRVMIAFGCTGGRHRSVVAAEEMKSRLSGRFEVRCHHRDLAEEANDIVQRFGEST